MNNLNISHAEWRWASMENLAGILVPQIPLNDQKDQ